MRSDNDTIGRRSFIEEARRAQIVAAAAETVAEVGYAQASLARIAERAGISKSVISYHFDGKHELLAQVAGEFFEQAWEHMAPRIDAAETAAGKLAAWITAEFEYFAAHRGRFLAMSEVVMNHRAPDGSRPFANDEADEIDGMADIVAAGRAAGEFRDCDPREMAVMIVRCTEGVVGSWAMDERVDLATQATALVDFVLHALGAGPLDRRDPR
ncbi:MAG TPA: TetR/AcrR family transcriptional regulator [Ilumatobacter sp.]|nr:TetR/AcrR family transcriptional regulator [Ilumatobacter sp.]